MVASVLVGAGASFTPSQAHCDSEQGPVAKAARQALETVNTNIILAYVQPEAETELLSAFKQTRSVRKAGGDTQALADHYFVETAIRLHRLGEGAPFTGVTDEKTPQAIINADRAMESGSMTELYKFLDQAIQTGIQEKYHTVVEAREQATRLNTVAAYRERAEAELLFEKYIYELYTVATAINPHTEGAAH